MKTRLREQWFRKRGNVFLKDVQLIYLDQRGCEEVIYRKPYIIT